VSFSAFFPKISQVIRANVETLCLESIQHEGPHGHVCVVSEPGELFAQAFT
jgi:hypothetical protein